jgi:hypothetical protein
LHGLPIAFGITRTEEDPSMEFIYKNFKKFIDENKNLSQKDEKGEKKDLEDRIQVIFVDKDLKNIKLLEQFFPKAIILLCTFHVVKYLH